MCNISDLDRALDVVKHNFRGPKGEYLIRISKVRDFMKVPLERETVMCAASFFVKHDCQEKR